MHGRLTSGLSTVCNISITLPFPPTIARAGSSPSHDPRQNRFILRQHLQDGSPQPLKWHVPPLEHSNNTVRRRLASNSIFIHVIFEVVFLHTVTDRTDCNGPQVVNIGAIGKCRRLSSQMKVGSVFRRRMAEYGSGEEEVKVMQMHYGDRPMGGQNIIGWGTIGIINKAGHVIVLNIGPGRGNDVTIKFFEFTLYPILAVISITCSSRIKPARTQSQQGFSPAAKHQNHVTACTQSGFESNRAHVGRNP